MSHFLKWAHNLKISDTPYYILAFLIHSIFFHYEMNRKLFVVQCSSVHVHSIHMNYLFYFCDCFKPSWGCLNYFRLFEFITSNIQNIIISIHNMKKTWIEFLGKSVKQQNFSIKKHQKKIEIEPNYSFNPSFYETKWNKINVQYININFAIFYLISLRDIQEIFSDFC